MKIEKINDNQIRCTLTREDLELRQINLLELAYGTSKAKALFSEMLKWASYKYGFEAENIPLMIEAVPLTDDSIVLIVTKVEYPEELDTRFSHFSEDMMDYDEEYDDYIDDEASYDNDAEKTPISATDIIDLFKKANQLAAQLKETDASDTTDKLPGDINRLYVFDTLDDVIELADVLGDFYHGKNALYKNNNDNRYYLIISKSDHTPEDFNKVCNIVSEYAQHQSLSTGSDAYFSEHYSSIILDNALTTLRKL